MVDVKCYICKELKDSTFDFFWCKDKRQKWCKDCYLYYQREWNRERAEASRVIKDNCGTSLQLAPSRGKKV